jgi:hypothetical protein
MSVYFISNGPIADSAFLLARYLDVSFLGRGKLALDIQQIHLGNVLSRPN